MISVTLQQIILRNNSGEIGMPKQITPFLMHSSLTYMYYELLYGVPSEQGTGVGRIIEVSHMRTSLR